MSWKKSGNLHLCIDYHVLKQRIKKDAYPLPLSMKCKIILQDLPWITKVGTGSCQWAQTTLRKLLGSFLHHNLRRWHLVSFRECWMPQDSSARCLWLTQDSWIDLKGQEMLHWFGANGPLGTGMVPDTQKVQVVKAWPVPVNTAVSALSTPWRCVLSVHQS